MSLCADCKIEILYLAYLLRRFSFCKTRRDVRGEQFANQVAPPSLIRTTKRCRGRRMLLGGVRLLISRDEGRDK